MQILHCRIDDVREIAEGIRSFRIIAADGGCLPAWDPGAHIDVRLPSGRVRQYSLCGDPADQSSYEIAVQQESAGRGGSREMFEAMERGSAVAISEPRNNFPLHWDAGEHLLVAGGIGITPILPMARALRRESRPFKLIYCTRSPQRAAFLDAVSVLASDGRAIVHHDGGQPESQLDFKSLLREQTVGTHLYCCGPEGLMRTVKMAAEGWQAGTVHWEHFTTAHPSDQAAADKPFRVELKKSGVAFEIPANHSILEILRDHGISVDSSCESGLCGTCKTRYVAGVPEHRDLILNDSEHSEYVMICCSRAESESLVLDL